MKSSVLNIPINKYKDWIFERFKILCGFFETDDIDRDRLKEAILCFWEYFGLLEVKSVYSFLDDNVFDDNNIYIDKCIFTELLKSNIFKFIFFAVSADTGVYNIKNSFRGDILKEFYFDLTCTAVIDISRKILKNIFEDFDFIKNLSFFVSNAFGPGFFGIGHKEVFSFFKLIDSDKIGLYLNESGVIYPEKSFIGFFVVSENEIFIGNDCESCVGNKKGCFFCEKHNF